MFAESVLEAELKKVVVDLVCVRNMLVLLKGPEKRVRRKEPAKVYQFPLTK